MENKKNNKIELLFLAIIVLMLFFVNSCGNDEEKPISCQCPNEATHLEVGASNVTCPANKCLHTGDCTEKINEMLGNGTTKIVKSVGVDLTAFNTTVGIFNLIANHANTAVSTSFKTNVTEVEVSTGSSISHSGSVVFVGCDIESTNIMPYLLEQGLVSTILVQIQTKSTWLADKGNKGRGWVGEYIETIKI